MKQKKNLSLFAQTAWMLSGAGRVAAVLLAVMLTMTAQTAWADPGDNIVVNCNGEGDYTSISAAVAAATGGETIFVKNGEYTETQPITIDKSLSIVGESGDGVVLKNIALRITSDDVTVSGITLNEDDADFTDIDTDNDGAAIYVSGSDVTLDGVSVTYNAPNEVEAKAIFADGADNFKLINSEITFTGADPGSNHYRGLEMRDCDEAIIDNNTISAEFPAVPVVWTSYTIETIDPDLVLAVGIQGGDDVEFTNNTVTVNTSDVVGYYPTIDAVMIHSANDILIKGNNITLIDTTPTDDNPRYYYSLDIYSTTGTVEANDITVNTTTATNDVERVGTAYPIQVSGPSTVTIKDNNLTAISKGSTAGIYAMNWDGYIDLTVKNNIIDVTGYTTTSNYYASVVGIEAGIDVLKAYNNTITVANVADYDDAYPVYGVGSQYFYNDPPSADIIDNIITVDGQYAVNYAEAQNANVTGNALCAHELTGDAAVYIKSGNNNTVKDNLLGYVIPKTGESTYNIPANVSSFKVYDDGGMGRTYSPGCAGTLTLTAPEGYRLQLSGSIKTEIGVDYLTVYDGSDDEADVLINQVSSSSNGTKTDIPTVTSTGQSITLYFCSNSSDSGSSEYDGLDLTVTLVPVLSETTGITDAASLQGRTAQFTRTFTAGVASTICLPFPMTDITGGTAYEFTAMEKVEDVWTATMSAVTETEAGQPYLFKASDDGAVSFSGAVPSDFTGVAASSDPVDYSEGGTWTFRGTYTTLTYGTNLDGAVYGFAGAAYSSISAGDFVKAEAGAYVSPFRCYLTYNAPSSARGMTRGADIELPSRIIVRLIGSNGQTTAIGSMDTKTGEVVFGNEWYTLDGRKLNGKPNAKGMYINNGKKIVVK